MCEKLFPVLVLCLICAISAAGQTVIESESSAEARPSEVVAALAVESPSALNVAASVELVDPDGEVRSSFRSTALPLLAGRNAVPVRLPFDPAIFDEDDDIAWFRIRYQIGSSGGTVSLSQLIKDLFELRILASDRVPTGVNYRTRVRALNPFTGAPMPGVAVAAVLEIDRPVDDEEDSVELTGTGVTDPDGFANIDIAIPPELRTDGWGEVTVTGRLNGVMREAVEDVDIETDDVQFLMMSDKPIYQPGQTFNLRGILLKGSLARTVMPGAPVEIDIRDEDNTLLYREAVEASEFGVASISWTIPENVRLGQYTVEAKSGSYGSIGSHTFKVSRYDLPNFVVFAKAAKPYYLPADREAEIEVNAQYLFGKPVTEGSVRVVREKSREWNWKLQKYDVDEGEAVEGQADNEGKFTAKFDLTDAHRVLEDDGWDIYQDLRFAAYFTDPTTNRTEQRRFDVRVTKEPIHVYVIRDWEYSEELTGDAYFSTFYADGSPCRCTLTIKAGDPASAQEADVIAELTMNSYGAAKLEINGPELMQRYGEDLYLTAEAVDDSGRRGTDKEIDLELSDDETIRIRTDKAIYRPGEPVRVEIEATKKTGTVYVDVARSMSVVDSHFATLVDGRASLTIPYRDSFNGEMTIAAMFESEEDEDEIVSTARGVIFPARQGLGVRADFEKPIYKPGDEAAVNISVLDVLGHAVQTALGIVVVDQAVDERARTDAEFSGSGWFSSWGRWLGYGQSFAGVNVKDLNELDLSKPISDDLQLTAEVILYQSYHRPNIFRSKGYDDQAKEVFGTALRAQFKPVGVALASAYNDREYLHPTDEAGLRDILSLYGIEFDSLADPWGIGYRSRFSINKEKNVVTLVSAGPDKRFGTGDDFEAFEDDFRYFTPTGKAIDAAAAAYFERTGEAIRGSEQLLKELGVDELLDRYGRAYRISYDSNGRVQELKVRSLGPDGLNDQFSWRGDDFDVWTSRIDLFAPIEQRIRDAQLNMLAPANEEEFRAALAAKGFDLSEVRDANGRPVRVEVNRTSRYWDRVSHEIVEDHREGTRTVKSIVEPVTQAVISFRIMGPGRDTVFGTSDDLVLTEVIHVVAEQAIFDRAPVEIKTPTTYSGQGGAITGVVTDEAGAVIPGATITATNDATELTYTGTSDSDGKFLIRNLLPGTYTLRAESPAFVPLVAVNLRIREGINHSIPITLQVGSVENAVTVSVSGGGESVVNTTSSSIATVVEETVIQALPGAVDGRQLLSGARGSERDAPISTPRLREYFPETLFWQPELITGEDGMGRATFRMADNITTWKMVAVASDRSGRLGIAESKVTAFQSFFADLDPPKFLTQGDEIFLPVQIRNYTDRAQKVDVEMDPGDWFSFLSDARQQIAVTSGAAENAVFGFAARQTVKEGKQRVTAIGETESDAIEKPVTVRPDGHEIVATDSKYFNGVDSFDVELPGHALPGTAATELKIYPNLFAHVVESVEGLLQRPYGCGEQTISSTYPNLMILKFAAENDRVPASVRAAAMKNLRRGYERLVGYQVADGGFSYWGGDDTADLALTAYALRFLNDAAPLIEVDREVVNRAENWLLGRQRSDGSWAEKYRWESTINEARSKRTTTYIARVLSMLRATHTAEDARTRRLDQGLALALGYLRKRNAEIDDPYAISLLGLTLLDAGFRDEAQAAAQRLVTLARREGQAAYWNLESNTVFNGWGTAGRIETTALALQLLMRSGIDAGAAIESGMVFLLKNKDRYGVWYSTQTTINVLDTFLAAMDASGEEGPQTVTVSVNGTPVETVEIAPDRLHLITLPLSGSIAPGPNNIELRSGSRSPMMAAVTHSYYVGWENADAGGRTANESRAIQMSYSCDKTSPEIMEEVTCNVAAERIGFRGYGMLLAEIGIPPGADVSRESLEKASGENWSFAQYEVLPDRIIAYLWANPGGTKFSFRFKPRYGINAKTPASAVYDYYNPEARATVAPLEFRVK